MFLDINSCLQIFNFYAFSKKLNSVTLRQRNKRLCCRYTSSYSGSSFYEYPVSGFKHSNCIEVQALTFLARPVDRFNGR